MRPVPRKVNLPALEKRITLPEPRRRFRHQLRRRRSLPIPQINFVLRRLHSGIVAIAQKREFLLREIPSQLRIPPLPSEQGYRCSLTPRHHRERAIRLFLLGRHGISECLPVLTHRIFRDVLESALLRSRNPQITHHHVRPILPARAAAATPASSSPLILTIGVILRSR